MVPCAQAVLLSFIPVLSRHGDVENSRANVCGAQSESRRMPISILVSNQSSGQEKLWSANPQLHGAVRTFYIQPKIPGIRRDAGALYCMLGFLSAISSQTISKKLRGHTRISLAWLLAAGGAHDGGPEHCHLLGAESDQECDRGRYFHFMHVSSGPSSAVSWASLCRLPCRNRDGAID